MPKRKRRDRTGTSEPEVVEGAAVDPQVALFAQRHKEQLERQKAAQRAEAARRKKEAEHQQLIDAKDAAVARVKSLRRRDRVAPGETAEADRSYKAALAALIEFETGAPPPWASTDEAAPDVDTQPEPQSEGQPEPDAEDA